MGKLLILMGIFLCFSLSATAQDFAAAPEASSSASEAAVPAPLSPSERDAWQLEFGYQYQSYKVLGQSFHNHGFHTDITRYVNNWLGVEGTMTGGFGHSRVGPYNLAANSSFLGGGLHITGTNPSRFEPWMHALVGWQQFRFTQTNNKIGLGKNYGLGIVAGLGFDFKIAGHAAWRVQGDYIGARINSSMPLAYSFGSGFVIGF